MNLDELNAAGHECMKDGSWISVMRDTSDKGYRAFADGEQGWGATMTEAIAEALKRREVFHERGL